MRRTERRQAGAQFATRQLAFLAAVAVTFQSLWAQPAEVRRRSEVDSAAPVRPSDVRPSDVRPSDVRPSGLRAGGGAFADFDSLIQLIQSTTAVDSWDTVGGSGTIQPYAQGVLVDPRRQLRPASDVPATTPEERRRLESAGAVAARLPTTRQSGDRRSGTRQSVEAAGTTPVASQGLEKDAAWMQSTELRCVSLKRMKLAIRHQLATAGTLDDALLHLAGLTRFQYVILLPDDIVLASPVGGIEAVDGVWLRDRQTGRGTIRLDGLSLAITAAVHGGDGGRGAFGCTIDPTPAGLRAAMSTAAKINANRIPFARSADEMRDALGGQNVIVFGTPADTHAALLMIAADRHMKQLALGTAAMPPPGKNYLDQVDAAIATGVPQDLLLRLWFTAKPVAVRHDGSRRIFELGGRPIRLSGQNERAVDSGQRGLITVDPRTEAFVAGFNRQWPAIRAKYPVYGALEAVYHSATVAEVLRRHASGPALWSVWADLPEVIDTRFGGLPILRRVDSLAVMHSARHGRRRHQLVIASGGVKVDPRDTIIAASDAASGTHGLRSRIDLGNINPDGGHWWWNARTPSDDRDSKD